MKKVFVFLFLVIFLFFIGYIYWSFLPVSNIDSNKSFVINQGDGLTIISTRLYKNKLTKNKYSFLVYAYLSNKSKQIKAGGFQLTSSDNLSEMLNKLTTGGSQDFWLKIIPGQRIEEISSKFEFEPNLEGYLFPDSYLIPNYYDVTKTVSLIRQNFDDKTSILNIDKNNLSQIVTIASLLEREAKTKVDKQMVAGIINNRLKMGMALQIDATVQYLRDTKNHPVKYWLQLSKNDLKIVSPFNTYLNPGLPPSPICNPGIDSLFAAQNPTASDYIYYIHGTDGTMHFAKTLAEHNKNIAKYLR
ncbi:MAG: endolytic transglycosylase MltG [Candidatus Shapirobacteria bacterium]